MCFLNKRSFRWWWFTYFTYCSCKTKNDIRILSPISYYFVRATRNIRENKFESYFVHGKKKERNEYTHCQFHLLLCAVNRTINHYVYPEGFTSLTCRSRHSGITRNLYLAPLCREVRWSLEMKMERRAIRRRRNLFPHRIDVQSLARTFYTDLRPNGRSFLLISATLSEHTSRRIDGSSLHHYLPVKKSPELLVKLINMRNLQSAEILVI